MLSSALRCSSQVRRTTPLCSLFHSSAVQNQKVKRKGSSRTRLADDIKSTPPPFPSNRDEVAAKRDSKFSREEAPHKDPVFVQKHNQRERYREYVLARRRANHEEARTRRFLERGSSGKRWKNSVGDWPLPGERSKRSPPSPPPPPPPPPPILTPSTPPMLVSSPGRHTHTSHVFSPTKPTQPSHASSPPNPTQSPQIPSTPPATKQVDAREERMQTYQSLLGAIQSSESEFYQPPSPVSISSTSNLNKDDENTAISTTTSTATAALTTVLPDLPLQQLQLPTRFTSPPLLPGFLPSLDSMLGPNARPTPIQALSLKWIVEPQSSLLDKNRWQQYLLASETGSGKSLAYLLPVLQRLKMDEETGVHDNKKTNDDDTTTTSNSTNSKRPLNPRAIILAPTHELSRQLSSFTKALTYKVRLRAMCVSQANAPSTTKVGGSSARQLAEQLDAITDGAVVDYGGGVFELKKEGTRFPVDVLIGTPVKIMEMIRGRGWDRTKGDLEVDEDGNMPKLRRGRDKMPGVGKWRKEPELGLEDVEWVVVDEADILFDPDFQEITRTLLADISAARGTSIQVNPTNTPLSSFIPVITSDTSIEPINYPFNLIFTSATIPKNFASYLDKYHPDLIRLTSPNLHRLPRTLQTEYVNWTGGNKFADIEYQIRKVWSDDAMVSRMTEPGTNPELSKILVFCNRSTRVHELAQFLEEKGVKCVALTSTSEQRKRGTNKHLAGFLRPVQKMDPDRLYAPEVVVAATKETKNSKQGSSEVVVDREDTRRDPKVTPHVMITTSLLSRGLDFVPELEHVFIVDEPRNMVDFLHRAGRSGRAGRKGKVVVFTKMKGRGSTRSSEVRARLRELMKRS